MQITQLDEHGVQDIPLEDLKRRLEAGTGTLWVDMVGPTPGDVRIMEDVFDFHPLAIEDTHNQRQRPKIEEYADHLFIILNAVSVIRERIEPPAPAASRTKKRKLRTPPSIPECEIGFRELDIFVGHNYVVSVHPGEEPAVAEARRRCTRANHTAISAGYLLYVMLDVVMDGYFPVLDVLGEEIDDLEDDILAAPRQETLNRLFGLKRKLNEVWRVAGQQRDMFNVITRRDLPFLDYEALQYHLRDVYDHLLRITDVSGTYRDLLTGLVDLYMSAVSNRLNRVVNRLTVITVGIGALAVITGFYGMNFEHTWPPFGSSLGVLFVIGLMAAVISLILLIFHRLGWY